MSAKIFYSLTFFLEKYNIFTSAHIDGVFVKSVEKFSEECGKKK